VAADGPKAGGVRGPASDRIIVGGSESPRCNDAALSA
jgi:hypothetical protein